MEFPDIMAGLQKKCLELGRYVVWGASRPLAV